MPPIVREEQKNGDKDRAPELHSQEGAHAADGAGGKVREKIGAAPRNGGSHTEQNAAGHLLGLVLFDFEAELGHDLLQIFPDIAFGSGITQQVSGVIGGDHFVAAIFKPLAAEMRNAAISLQQSLRSGCAEADDDFWLERIELAE